MEKSEKKKVRIQIEGRGYSLITADDERYVQRVADEVIKSIRDTAGGAKKLDTRDCAVLAALNFCDDRNKARKKAADCLSKADKIIRQSNELNKKCSEYREKLTEAINENTVLTQNNKELEKKLAVLKFETEQLRAKLKKYEDDDKNSKADNHADADKPTKRLVHGGKITPNDKAAQHGKKTALNVLSDKAQEEERERRSKELLGYVPMKQYSLFDDDKSDKQFSKR